MSSPPLPGTSRLRLSRAAWPLAVMAVAPTHVGPRPTPGFADGEWHHALPSAAQHQPSSPMARATAPRTRGTPAQAQAGLRQAGSSIMPSPLLPGNGRAA